MFKYYIVAAVLLILAVLIYFFDHSKEAYKVLPITTQSTETPDPHSTWVPYVSKEGDFAAKFPTPPQQAKDSVDIPDSPYKRLYDMYVSQHLNGSVYMVSVITYPKEHIDENSEQEMLHMIINEMVDTNPNNELKNVEEKTFLKYNALEYNIINNSTTIQGIVFLKDHKIYVLNHISKMENFEKHSYDHFLNSFRLLSEAFTKPPSNGQQTTPVQTK